MGVYYNLCKELKISCISETTLRKHAYSRNSKNGGSKITFLYTLPNPASYSICFSVTFVR